jgi:hypothetical protein
MSMPSVPSAQELIRVVREYYPQGIELDDPRYKASAEAQRLQRLIEEAHVDLSRWADFVAGVRHTFPDCVIWDRTLLWHDPCFRLHVSLPGMVVGGRRFDMVVCLLSLLAPVYAIYASHIDENPAGRVARTCYPPLPAAFQSHEQALAQRIEVAFGFVRLPKETLVVPMPGFRPRTGHFIDKEPVLADH